MKLTDILALAKAGYKAGEIKELLSMDSKEPEGAESPAEIPEKGQAQPVPEKADEQPQPQDPNSEDKIKALEAQITELQNNLKAAQAQNAARDISNENKIPDNQQVLDDLVRNFM